MKKKIILIVLISLVLLSGCDVSDSARQGALDALNDTREQEENEPMPETEAPIATTEQKETEDLDANTEQEENVDLANNTEESETPLSIESGKYNIADIEFDFSDSVKNDMTGNWRKATTSTSEQATSYALEYYNTLFESDDEIHAVVNYELNTTNKISVIHYMGVIDITVHEHVDGEEHNAKELFGGKVLEEYWIDLESGEIEKIR